MSSYWLPQDISSHGARIDLLVNFIHWFMGLLFAGWAVFFVYCLIRFRQRDRRAARYEPIRARTSKLAEVGVILVEAIMLVGLSMPVWGRVRTDFPPPEKQPLRVRVVAQQFEWGIHYPGKDGIFGPTRPELVNEAFNPLGLDRNHPDARDDITTRNDLRVPVNRPVIAYLSSKDVIHSFWIPPLRIKQDAIPGMQIPVWFEATQTTDQLRESMARTLQVPPAGADLERVARRQSTRVALEEVRGPGGEPILRRREMITAKVLAAHRAAGIAQVRVGPRTPAEIQCAQLCGLGHFRMRGAFTVLAPEEFDRWMADRETMIPSPDDEEWDDED